MSNPAGKIIAPDFYGKEEDANLALNFIMELKEQLMDRIDEPGKRAAVERLLLVLANRTMLSCALEASWSQWKRDPRLERDNTLVILIDRIFSRRVKPAHVEALPVRVTT